MLKEHSFKIGEHQLNFAEGPASRAPFVLIHGGGDRWQNFLPILPTLTMRWHVFAVDLRGHGKSGRVPGEYRPEHYVADIIPFIDHYFTEPVNLFGHSLGGWVALMVAAQLQTKIKTLILGDPPLNLERFVVIESSEARIQMWQMMHRIFTSNLSIDEITEKLANLPVASSTSDGPSRYADLPGMDAASILAWAKTLNQVDPDALMYHTTGRISAYVENVNIEADLQRITCPLLLLQLA